MQERPEDTNSAPVALVKPASSAPAPRPPVSESDIFFTRAAFDAILSLYGRKVVEGEWRDYAIGSSREVATFAVHRRASEQPLFRIEKRPKLARRQGAFSVVAASGLVMKRGHELSQVLKVFEKRVLRIIDA